MITEVLIPVVLILFVLLALGFPVYVPILCAALYLQIFVNGMPVTSLFNGMIEALTKNSLLAVPFFIVAGNLMSTGSLGRRLVDFCAVATKRIPGGLGLTCVVANAIFGAISGSAPAATATFGRIMWEPLRKEYGDEEAAGLITSAGSLSPIIPPSLSLIMFGIITETSLAGLFMAGFLPGVLCALILFIYLFFRHKKDVAGRRLEKGELSHAFKTGIPALLLPIIILGSIYGGICSPTEAGAVAAIYSGIVSVFIIRDVKLIDFCKVFKDSAKTIGQLFILIAVSTVFSQALTVTQAPQALQDAMSGLSPVAYLLIVNIILLILGCFMDPGPATLLVAPILVPIGLALGINIFHMGVVYAVNLSIGMFTPPFGLSLFVSQSVLGKPMSAIVKGSLPFLVCFLISLIIITYVPDISLFLPSVLN